MGRRIPIIGAKPGDGSYIPMDVSAKAIPLNARPEYWVPTEPRGASCANWVAAGVNGVVLVDRERSPIRITDGLRLISVARMVRARPARSPYWSRFRPMQDYRSAPLWKRMC